MKTIRLNSLVKNSKWLRMVSIITWMAGFILLFYTLIAGNINHRSNFCSQTAVKIDHHTGVFFIREDDIEKYLQRYCHDSITRLNEIDLHRIEVDLRQNPFIKDAYVYIDAAGTLHADIAQRIPIARVINIEGVSFYIDENGQSMPVSDKFTARVPVVTGFTGDGNDTLELQKIYHLVSFINRDAFWRAQTQQIHINGEGDFEIIPRLGAFKIIIGDTSGLNEKFNKMDIFYKEIVNRAGWSKYKAVNVKFKDQIVCTKY